MTQAQIDFMFNQLINEYCYIDELEESFPDVPWQVMQDDYREEQRRRWASQPHGGGIKLDELNKVLVDAWEQYMSEASSNVNPLADYIKGGK